MYKLKQVAIAFMMVASLSLGGPTLNASARPLGIGTVPPLGTAVSFAVLAGAGITNTGSTTIAGDVGTFPTPTEVGMGPCPGANCVTLTGTNHAGDAVTQGAKNDLTTAYNNAAGQACDSNVTGQDLGSLTLTPGVYCFDSSAGLTGTLTLDAVGDPNAVWIFQLGSTLTTASNSAVSFVNAGSGPAGCNVYWQIGSSATLGTGTSFVGTIMTAEDITLTTGATVLGRVLAQGVGENGAVTLDTNTITVPVCAAAAGGGEDEDEGASRRDRRPTVSGLPNTGGAPIRNDEFPWGLMIVGGVSTAALFLGARSYRRKDISRK